MSSPSVSDAAPPTLTEHPAARATRPENDEFYCPPPDFAARPPGAILRTRVTEIALFGVIAQRFPAWQLLYRTSDLHGTPEVAVTTVLLPVDAEAIARPLVSFQCAIDGVGSNCFPSYALRRGARALGAIPQLELPVIAEALARGWAVSIPDHGGMGGHFGVAREPGYRALDAARAALAFEPLGLTPTTEVGLWGYSGGGLATAWAAEVAAHYAPDLNIVGAVAGSPVGDPGATFVRLNGSLLSGFSTVCVAALQRAYPELEQLLAKHAKLEFHTLLADAASRTTLALLSRFAGKNLDRYSESSFADLLNLPEMRALLDDIRPGLHAPSMPVLVIQGVNDELIAVQDVDRHVERYRRAGAHVHYVRDRLSMHLALLYLGTPMTMAWLADRFEGNPLPPSTTTTVWSLTWRGCDVTAHLRFAAVFVRMLCSRAISQRHK